MSIGALTGQGCALPTRMLVHESNIKPVYYAPIEDFAEDLLVTSEHTTHCPFKGDASYWSLKVGQRVKTRFWGFYKLRGGKICEFRVFPFLGERLD